MRSEIVKKRLKDVLRVDSIASSQGDFLATHVPFRKMTVINGHGTTQSIQEISEEEVFQTYFDNASVTEQHQLMIVEGASGAGKSHFIRWIHAKLMNLENQNEIVLLIRRSDNTLKGTIKQLLEREELKNIQNREVYERLVRANQTISEQKLKNQIFHRFLAEIQSDEDSETESTLNRSRKKGLYALLSNSLFEERMMASGGAIERIFNKVTFSESGSNQDTVALFEPEDFILTTDFVEEMRNAGADHKATKTADWLIPDEDEEESNAKKVADYMNSHVEEVIQSCAGIEPGDFQQIFKEIRQELYRQGKRLTLLIEDITSFTGINQALLSVLITEHTGMNEADHICRLVSVVGTTSEYYRQFRDNYKDRITTQITIHDSSVGDTELIQFVAKYLNVMSLEPETIEEWLKNGAREDEYPVHQVTEGQNWESVSYQKKKLSLYPFTRAAVRNLYSRMGDSRTPRYILRDIVEPAVNDILSNREGFPAFCKNIRTGLPERVDSRIHNMVNQLPIPETEKTVYCERVLYLIGIWGDGTLDSGKDTLGGLPLKIYRELGLQMFTDAAYQKKISPDSGRTAPTPIEEVIPESSQEEMAEPVQQTVIDPELEKRQKKYKDFYDIATKWRYENQVLTGFELIRDAIEDYIYSAINWQQEDISVRTISYIKTSSKKLIGFVNQNRGFDRIMIPLDAEEENYQLLLSFAKWLHLGKKSWNFEESETAVYHATVWLLKYHERIVQAVKGDIQPPVYLRCAMMAEMYRKILNGEYTGHTLNKVSMNTWLTLPSGKSESGHSETWQKHLEAVYANSEMMKEIQKLSVQYFNLIQGTSENSSKYILKYSEFQKVLRQICRSGLILTESELQQKDEIPKREAIIQYFRQLLPKLEIVAKAEMQEAKSISEELLRYFEFDEDAEIEIDDVRDMLNDIRDFYQDASNYGVNLAMPFQKITKLLNSAKILTDAVLALQKDVSESSTLEILLNFADDPIRKVRPFLELLRQTEIDLQNTFSRKSQEKETLTRQGGWSEHTDPRFQEKQSAFETTVQKFREVTG